MLQQANTCGYISSSSKDRCQENTFLNLGIDNSGLAYRVSCTWIIVCVSVHFLVIIRPLVEELVRSPQSVASLEIVRDLRYTKEAGYRSTSVFLGSFKDTRQNLEVQDLIMRRKREKKPVLFYM